MTRLTLEDIGKLAGVSRATVSRVINGYPHIRPEVRERVEKVVAETGFRPNAVARSLASNRTNMLGLIVPSIVQEIFSDPYFPTLIQGVTQEGGRHGQIVSLYLFNNFAEVSELAENIVQAGFLDGVILTMGNYNLRSIIANSHIPFVTIGQPKDTEFLTVPHVDTDNFMGGYRATKHLLELGHRRIGIVAADIHRAGIDRLHGYQHALAEYGIAVDEALITNGDFSLESGATAAIQLLPHQPTAIFVSSDRMALGVLQVLKAAHVRVPEDLALVGFDNLSPALMAEPNLTTIDQHVEKLGAAAVDLLLKMINQPDQQHPNIILPTELVIRESCGAQRRFIR